MSCVKCFDFVSTITEESTKQFGVFWEKDSERELDLKNACSIIDELYDEFDGLAFEFDVNDITMDIKVTLECKGLEVYEQNHNLYDLLHETKRFSVSLGSDDSHIRLYFVFPGIWNKKKKL